MVSKVSFRRRSGFTLVELLVVMVIMGILTGFLTGAVQDLMRGANDRRTANNATLLKAAILEYRHDFGKWPIPVDILRNIEPDENTGAIAISFSDDNNKVIQNLVGVELADGHKRDYLALQGFITPAQAPTAVTYPTESVVDAALALEGTATDDDGRTVKREPKDMTVLFHAQFLKCPRCGTCFPKTASRKYCTNDDCPAYADDGERYRFSVSDRRNPVSRACPFTIKFDFYSNRVSVDASYQKSK